MTLAYDPRHTGGKPPGWCGRVTSLVLLIGSCMFLLREAILYASSRTTPSMPIKLPSQSPNTQQLRGAATSNPPVTPSLQTSTSLSTPHLTIEPPPAAAAALLIDPPTCAAPCRVLRNGVEMPLLIYGTAWKEDRSERLVSLALTKGFRAVDTANQRRHYNEVGAGAAVAAAIQSGKIKRSELFLQSKYTFPRGHLEGQVPYDVRAAPSTQVGQTFENSLAHFGGTPYLDSFIIHGPLKHGPTLSEADFEVWLAIEQLYRDGKVRAIGVSNFGQQQLQQLIADPRTNIVPHVAQIRTFASTGWDDRVGGVRSVCEREGIVFEAFSLLTANKRELNSPVVGAVAKKWGQTKEQAAFRFALGEGMVVLTGTSDELHMEQDLTVASSMMHGSSSSSGKEQGGGTGTAGGVPGATGDGSDGRLDPVDAAAIRDIRQGRSRDS